MKKLSTLFCLLALMFIMPQNLTAQNWSYDFEDFGKLVGTGNKKKAIEVELNGWKWHMCGVASSTDEMDFFEGACSMKLYGEQDCSWKAAEEYTNFTLAEKHSIGKLSFAFAPHQYWAGNEMNQVAWIVQFSTDGNSWTTVGDPFKTWEEPIMVEREINHPSAMVRIVREDYQTVDFTKGMSYAYICNIDNINITEFTGTEVPELFASVNTLEFGEVEKGQEVEKTFTLTHKNLSSPVEMYIDGADAAAFSIKTKELGNDGTDEIKVSFKPFKKGEFKASFVAKSGVLKINVNLEATGKTAEGVKFTGGTGTVDDPYIISCKEDLFELSDDVETQMESYAGKYFLMTNDIDMANVKGFRSIGNNFDRSADASDCIRPFSGIFDGGNHTVYNLIGEWGDYGFVGLFGIIQDATIKNLTVAKSTIYGDFGAAAIVGAGMYDCVISNCHTADDVMIGNRKFYVAGICSGLLVSGAKGSVIEDCTNRATVHGVVGYSAGILATNGQSGTQILRCGNYGDITDDNLHVAGIVSNTSAAITIVDSYNMGHIMKLTLEGATNALGAGILATNYDAPESEEVLIQNCYNLGTFNVIGNEMHPIFNEEMSPYFNTTVENCYFSEDVNSFDFGSATHVALADMKTQAFVDMLNNGRADAPWVIKENVNKGYPVPEGIGESTGIMHAETAAAHMSYVSGIVTVAGVKAGAQVIVTDIAGRMVMSIKADAQGCADVDMTSLTNGTYVVSADGNNIKVVR